MPSDRDQTARAPRAALRAYLVLARALRPVAPRLLARRLARGKEDPARWREKLGEAGLPRPEGTLIWLHAVGLGEVLALRGLIGALAERRPGTEFLVTSGTRASAEVLQRNLPPHTRHQFLPLDSPAFVARFLDHWRPDLAVWSEQDLWPAMVYETDRRGIPLALVNARMNDRAFAARVRVRGLYADLYQRFRLISAQDPATARHLAALGANGVEVAGSLKPAAPPLSDNPAARAEAAAAMAGRRLWLCASSHAGDEAVALAAQAELTAQDPAWLLILAPRDPARAPDIAEAARAQGLTATRRSQGKLPGAGTAVWIADTFGELGLWYRLASVSLIGGSLSGIGGHNPWEAVRLGSAVLHGPDVANFAADYRLLDEAEAALELSDVATLAAALQAPQDARIERATAIAAGALAGLDDLCDKLIALLR